MKIIDKTENKVYELNDDKASFDMFCAIIGAKLDSEKKVIVEKTSKDEIIIREKGVK